MSTPQTEILVAYGVDVDAVGGWLAPRPRAAPRPRRRLLDEDRPRRARPRAPVIFPMTIHPDVSGRPQTLLMHERLIAHFRAHDGVRFVRFTDIAADFRARHPRG